MKTLKEMFVYPENDGQGTNCIANAREVKRQVNVTSRVFGPAIKTGREQTPHNSPAIKTGRVREKTQPEFFPAKDGPGE